MDLLPHSGNSSFDFDTIQLHGDEDQNFISEVKSNFKKKIYKSISPEDFKTTELVDVDWFLIEAKPSSNQMPGGNNTTWDWSDFKNIKAQDVIKHPNWSMGKNEEK
mgnify:CR=1 FL=1